MVDAASQNSIVIIPGGNGQLTPASVQRYDALLQAAEVIICQLEVPMTTVAWTLARGRELGKTVILNPAPATGPLPSDWFADIDYLTPNESEAEALTGLPVTDIDSARRAGERLLQLGAGKVIVTLGRRVRCSSALRVAGIFPPRWSSPWIPPRQGIPSSAASLPAWCADWRRARPSPSASGPRRCR